jgi:hypothetical protein
MKASFSSECRVPVNGESWKDDTKECEKNSISVTSLIRLRCLETNVEYQFFLDLCWPSKYNYFNLLGSKRCNMQTIKNNKGMT